MTARDAVAVVPRRRRTPRVAVPWPGRVTATGWRLAAVAVAALSGLLAATAAVLQLAHGSLPAYPAYWVMDVVTAVVYGAVCLLVLPRSRHPVVWILVAGALGCAVSGVLTPYLALAAGDPGLPAPAALAALSTWVWMPGTYASIAVLPWLVSPGRAPRWVRGLVALGLAAVSWRVLGTITSDRLVPDNPLARPPGWYDDLVATLGLWPDRLCVALSLAGVVWLAWLRRAGGPAGRGYGWLALGQLFLAVAFVPVVFPAPAGLEDVAADFAGASLIAAQAFLPGALLVVVLGQRLWGIDLAVDRLVVGVSLSVALLTGYLVTAWFVQQQLAWSEDAASLTALAVLLVASQPLRDWIRRRADRLVHGDRDPTVLIGSLGTGEIEAVAGALARGLRLGGVEVRDSDGVPVVAVGRAVPAGQDTHRVPLEVRGRPRGELLATAPVGQRLDLRARRLLDEVSGLVAVALELATVNGRLEEATARLVQVRQEERRMLRRDLHDGVGPALAGIGLGLAAAQRRLEHDPPAARRLLEELADELVRRTQDVRMLAHSLLPGQLDDGDLAGALAALAARFQTSGLRVTVDCTPPADLATADQIAVYHVGAEALLNAHRHARARQVTLTVTGTDSPPGATVLEVLDDGCGLGADVGRGVGLRSMQERAEERGGSLEVGPGPGDRGTLVRMVLP